MMVMVRGSAGVAIYRAGIKMGNQRRSLLCVNDGATLTIRSDSRAHLRADYTAWLTHASGIVGAISQIVQLDID